MSAFAAVRQSDRILLLTDAAIYKPDGTLLDIRSKVRAIPGMRAAMTIRGELTVLECLVQSIARRALSFDFLVAHFDTLLAISVECLRQAIGDRADRYEIVLCGWSESRDRPEVYYVVGHDRQPGAEPGRLVMPDGAFIGAPDPGPERLAALDEPGDANAFAPELHGLALMEAMRRTNAIVDLGSEGAVEGYGVGGWAQLTTVTRDGVSSRILRHWPDRIGSKIDPDGDARPLQT